MSAQTCKFIICVHERLRVHACVLEKVRQNGGLCVCVSVCAHAGHKGGLFSYL